MTKPTNLMRQIKNLLPWKVKRFIHRLRAIPNQLFSSLVARHKRLACLYYCLISSRFDFEMKSVLAGHKAYRQGLKQIARSSTLLRRNTHRLEKGLIMRPRRDSFAEDFILETVRTFELANQTERLSGDEKKWCHDVLAEYFSVVVDTPEISKARRVFESRVETDPTLEAFSPYARSCAETSAIGYNDLYQLFVQRRSVRWYQKKTVPQELIEKAIKASSLAPSACNRQPFSFYIAREAEKAVAIANCVGGTAGFAKNLQAMIAIVGDLSCFHSERDRHIIYIDGSLAAMQLMLALETLGLSSCPINWPDDEKAENKIRQIIPLAPYERPIMLLSVGYADETGGIPYSKKKSLDVMIKPV